MRVSASDGILYSLARGFIIFVLEMEGDAILVVRLKSKVKLRLIRILICVLA